MREIKFRAWDGEGMRDVFSVQAFSGEVLYAGGIKDWKLMQYTGLKDKNGVEIYEGDIIRRGTGYVFEVKVREYALGFANNASAFGYDIHHSDEIIGNIYEHPNLLS